MPRSDLDTDAAAAVAADDGDAARIDAGSQLNEPPGRRLAGNLAVVAKALTDTEPKALENVMAGITHALGALEAVGRGRPPDMFASFRLMRDHDTRRGLHAVTRLVQAIGEQLRHAAERAADSKESLPAHPDGDGPSRMLGGRR